MDFCSIKKKVYSTIDLPGSPSWKKIIFEHFTTAHNQIFSQTQYWPSNRFVNSYITPKNKIAQNLIAHFLIYSTNFSIFYSFIFTQSPISQQFNSKLPKYLATKKQNLPAATRQAHSANAKKIFIFPAVKYYFCTNLYSIKSL